MFVPSDTITSNGIICGVSILGIVIDGVDDVAFCIINGVPDVCLHWYDTRYCLSLLFVPSSDMVDNSGIVTSAPASAVGGMV